MYGWLHDAIAGGAEVVTASRRLARELQLAYDRLHQARGTRAWCTAPVLSWNDWLAARLDAAEFSRQLPLRINHNASALLWERCLRERIDDGLSNFASLVRQAQDSWQRLNDWRIPLEKLSDYSRSYDQQLFLLTAGSYQRLLGQRDWIDNAGVAGAVTGLFEAHALPVPRALIVAGFDRLTPANEQLFQVLRDQGCDVREPAAGESERNIRLTSFPDAAAELRAVGSWARAQLSDNAALRIAIVRAGLETHADEVARLVREGLACGWQYGDEAHRSAVNISYGRRLADYPAVAVALLYLQWLRTGLTTREVSVLLRSRLSAAEDTAGRSRLELRLRRMPERCWTPSSLVAALRGPDHSEDSQRWLKSIEQLVAMRRRMPRSASPAEWAQQIDALLAAVAWPGDAVADSEEFQLLNRWRSLLNEFAALDLVVPKMTFAEAVRRISTLAAECVFQPQSAGALVDVLGALEAAGMEFDAVWISGLDANQWPPAGNPSVLIPRSLQREFGMTDATPGDTLGFARSVFDRLIASAGEVMLSWAESGQDTELVPSPLLDPYLGCDVGGVADPGWHAGSLQDSQRMGAVMQDPAPAIRADEIVAGGAYTVQRQVTEPFSAFAHGRLRVKELTAIETGLPAHLRGSLVHDALHALYADNPTLKVLQAWQDRELDERISAALDAAIRRHTLHADVKQQRLLQLEHARLERLLRRFIELERARPVFSVAGVETSIELERHGIRLDLRVDRIDRQADGALLVLDYKTGRPKNLLNRDGNPADLQLVVYASALGDRVAGLALVNIDSREITYKGAGSHFDKNPQQLAAWHKRLTAWEAQVDDALRAVATGDARINVLQTASEGRPLNILSRLEELRHEL